MSGKGRGRGWLQLDKTQDVRPGPGSINDMNEMPPNVSKYDKIIDAINHFNDTDDGILLNQKITYVLEVINSQCTADDLEEAIIYVYNRALESNVFVHKFIKLITLNSFLRSRIFDMPVRNLIVTRLQHSYENVIKTRADKTIFHNAILILSMVYSKLTLTDSNVPLNVFSKPLLHYLNMLIDSGQPDDIELFGTQLYLNGLRMYESKTIMGDVKFIERSQFTDLANKARDILINAGNLSSDSKVWLLFSIDLTNNDYNMPQELAAYYQSKLNDKVILNVQNSLDTLTIQTQDNNKVLENYSSDVNVLQVDAKVIDHHNPQPLPTVPNNYVTSSAFSQARAGRPILGSGARRSNTEIDASRRSDKTATSRANAKHSDWGMEQNNVLQGGSAAQRLAKPNKGWQHDDRFDTDY